MTDAVKFTQADKDFFAAVRKEQPEVDQLFQDLRALMADIPGSQVTYLKIGESEWGQKSPEPAPDFFRPQTIPFDKNSGKTAVAKKPKKPTTQAEKYRAVMRFKE